MPVLLYGHFHGHIQPHHHIFSGAGFVYPAPFVLDRRRALQRGFYRVQMISGVVQSPCDGFAVFPIQRAVLIGNAAGKIDFRVRAPEPCFVVRLAVQAMFSINSLVQFLSFSDEGLGA